MADEQVAATEPAAEAAPDPWAEVHEGRQPAQVKGALEFVAQLEQAGGLEAVIGAQAQKQATELAVDRIEKLLSEPDGQKYLRERLGVAKAEEEYVDPVEQRFRALEQENAQLKRALETGQGKSEEALIAAEAMQQRARVEQEFTQYIQKNDLQDLAPRMWGDIQQMMLAAPQHFLSAGSVQRAAEAWYQQISEVAPLIQQRAARRASRVAPGGGGGSPQKSPETMTTDELREATYRHLGIQ